VAEPETDKKNRRRSDEQGGQDQTRAKFRTRSPFRKGFLEEKAGEESLQAHVQYEDRS